MASNVGVEEADDLTNAAAEGNIVMVRKILDRRVHPDSKNQYGRTAIQTMNWHCPDIAKLLLEYGANPNLQDPNTSQTTLHDAVQHGIEETVLCLLQGGADASIRDKFGKTPYDLAMEMGHKELAEKMASFQQTQ